MTDIQFDRQVLKENMGKALQSVVVLSFTVPEGIRAAVAAQQQRQLFLQQQQQQQVRIQRNPSQFSSQATAYGGNTMTHVNYPSSVVQSQNHNASFINHRSSDLF